MARLDSSWRDWPTPYPLPQESALAALCAAEGEEPAAAEILIDQGLDCLHYLGATGFFLRIPEGAPTRNLLAMLRETLCAALQPALRRAWSQNSRVTVDAGLSIRQGNNISLRLDLIPLCYEGKVLMLIRFVEKAAGEIRAEALLPKTLFPVTVSLLRPSITIALTRPVIFIVDKDEAARSAIRSLLESDGHLVEDFASAEAFLLGRRLGREACLLIDPDLPGMSGAALLHHLRASGQSLPTIVIPSKSTVPMAVEAMRSGACDFLAKPLDRNELLASLRRALEKSQDDGRITAGRDAAVNRIAGLTPRQHQIMAMVLAGHPNKNIAADLDISQRTVEHHRASIMEKTGSKSLPALARLALEAI